MKTGSLAQCTYKPRVGCIHYGNKGRDSTTRVKAVQYMHRPYSTQALHASQCMLLGRQALERARLALVLPSRVICMAR